MQLPNSQQAIISEAKIVGYLLNPAHPDGAGKAKFFQALGFRADQWSALSDALRKMVEHSPVAAQIESRHGWKYIVDGTIDSPSGASAEIRTVWIVERSGTIPRLVTAFPRKLEE